MKIFYEPQGSPEWLQARLGIPSASEFKKIITKTGKLSSQAEGYAHQLIAEELLGEPIKDLSNLYWIERGKMLEPDAVEAYEAETFNQTVPIGFITNDEGTLGCSPDRLVKSGGLLEIKCPAPQTHVGYGVDGFDEDYKPQVQGQLYVTGLEWSEWFSYHPDFPPVLMRIERDEKYIDALAESLLQFVEMKKDLIEKLKAKGFIRKQDRDGV